MSFCPLKGVFNLEPSLAYKETAVKHRRLFTMLVVLVAAIIVRYWGNLPQAELPTKEAVTIPSEVPGVLELAESPIRALTIEERATLAAAPDTTPGWQTYQEGQARPISMGAEDAFHEIWWWTTYPLPCLGQSFTLPWFGNLGAEGVKEGDYDRIERWSVTESLTGYNGQYLSNAYYQFGDSYLFFSPSASYSTIINPADFGDGGAKTFSMPQTCGTLAYGTKPGVLFPAAMMEQAGLEVTAEIVKNPHKREGFEDYTHFQVNNQTGKPLEIVVRGDNGGPDYPYPYDGSTIITDPKYDTVCCPGVGLPAEYFQYGDTYWVAVFREGLTQPSATVAYTGGLKIGDTLLINVSQPRK